MNSLTNISFKSKTERVSEQNGNCWSPSAFKKLEATENTLGAIMNTNAEQNGKLR